MDLVRNKSGTTFHRPDCVLIGTGLLPWELAKGMTREALANALCGGGRGIPDVKPCARCKPMDDPRSPELALNEIPTGQKITDHQALDIIQAFMSKPGDWNGGDVCEVVADLLERTCRRLT